MRLPSNPGYYVIESTTATTDLERWSFVNGQLKNKATGKCVTAWSSSSWYLYLDDCSKQYPGQEWIDRGSQIVNQYGFCITTYPKKAYLFQDYCDTAKVYFWYRWKQPPKKSCTKYQHRGNVIGYPSRNWFNFY
jgi:hypothetical protein